MDLVVWVTPVMSVGLTNGFFGKCVVYEAGNGIELEYAADHKNT